MTNVDKILEELKPFKDKVLINPLSKEEVEIIQSKFNKRIPEYFREFLLKIGLKQDFVWGINNRIGKFEDLGEFLSSEDYFKFGDNGGEDYWLLKFEDEKDRSIYEYDYYCDGEIKSIGKTFDNLLIESLDLVKNRYENLTLNEFKGWCVQFFINTGSGKFLASQLNDKLEIPIQLISEPKYTETSDAGVKCYEGIISIDGKKIKLGKQIIKGVGSSNLFFDWQESVNDMKNNSLIKKLDKALDKSVFKHKIIDYGILNLEELKRIE